MQALILKKSGLVIALLILLLGFSCGKKEQAAQESQADQTVPIKIGFLMDDYNVDRWYKDKAFFIEKVKELGAEPIVEVANSDDANQLAQAKQMIKDGVQVLVVVPTNGYSAAAIVDTANKANVPVIAYERLIMDSNLDYYISYDNSKVGELQGEFVTKLKPEGKYIIISGPTSDFNTDLVEKGLMKVLNPFIATGKIKLMYKKNVNEWTDLESLMMMDDYFSNNKNKNPDVILAANDNLATGVIMALEKYNLAGKVLVTGQDADVTGCKQIVAGTQIMSVYKAIKPLAYKAAEVAVKLAKKQEITEVATTLNNNKVDVKTIYLDTPPIAVNKENLKTTVIADGFIKEEDVYGKKTQ